MFDEPLPEPRQPAGVRPPVPELPQGVRVRPSPGRCGGRLVYDTPPWRLPVAPRDESVVLRLRAAVRTHTGLLPPPPPEAGRVPTGVDELEGLIARLPGEQLAGWLATVDPAGLTEPAAVAVVRGWERVRDWATAGQVRALAALPGRDSSPVDDAVREEVAAALTWSPTDAGWRLSQARHLVAALPETLQALEAGRIGSDAAAAIARGTLGLAEEQARAVQDVVLPDAAGLTPRRVARAVRSAKLAVGKPDAEERRRRARQDRWLTVDPADDDMAYLTAYLPAVEAATVATVVETLAAPTGPADGRTAGQRRVDAFAGVFRALADAGELPTRQRVRPHVTAVAALSTLRGEDDLPGELERYGPVHAGTVRDLLAAGPPQVDLDLALTDDAGRLTRVEPLWRGGRRLPPPDLSAPPAHAADGHAADVDADAAEAGEAGEARDRYRPGSALARFITLRDRSCRFPGCDAPAVTCDLDHLDPHGRSGRTRCDNLHALCRRHHRLKHEGGWTVQGDPAGTLTWTSPQGRTATTRPAPLPVAEPPRVTAEPDEAPSGGDEAS